MSTQENDSTGNVWRWQYVPVVLLVVLGTVASVTAFLAAYSWEQRSIRRDFDSLAEDRFHAIGTMFEQSATLLSFTDNVFMIGPQPDSPQFTDYVRSLKAFLEKDMARHPELHALIWTPRVPRDQQAAYERTARAVFDPAFKISDPSTGSDAQRSESFLAYLCIATTPGHDRPGKDLSLNPAIREAMQRACDSGAPVAIAPTKTAARANDRLGYPVFQPLYRNGDPGDTASRREALAGFLCLDLDIGEMVDSAFAGITPAGIDIFVRDDTDASSVTVCRHVSRLKTPVSERDGQKVPDELESTWTTTLFGRKVTLCCYTTPSFWAGRTIWQPWLLLCAGLALTLTGASVKFSHARHNIMIERNVAARMATFYKELRQQQQARSKPERGPLPANLAQDEPQEDVPTEPMPAQRWWTTGGVEPAPQQLTPELRESLVPKTPPR